MFHVLAGPPGAGKTTVFTLLCQHLPGVPEAARRVLAEQRRTGGTGTGEQDPDRFIALMAAQTRQDHAGARGPTVFDRGAPDLLAFCAHYQLDVHDAARTVASCRYASPVFWFPPWPGIYAQDAERRLDFDGACAFGELVRSAYLDAGYQLVEVPQGVPEARADFILARITT